MRQTGRRAILTIIALPLWMAVMTLLYYDLRVRREGFDLQVRTEQVLGTPDLNTPSDRLGTEPFKHNARM